MEEQNKMERKRGEMGEQERGKEWKNGIKWKAKDEKRKIWKEEDDGRKGGGKVKNLKPLFYEISGSPRES